MGLLAVLPANVAVAADSRAADDKSQYTLFNPTPERLLREFETDEPDITEDPFTVDAGHVQFETSLFSYARSRPDAQGAVTHSYEFAETSIRIGVTNNAEFNIIWHPYGVVRTSSTEPQEATRSAGIGALTLRSKINLWGNDNYEKPGATALALMPYVILPTDRGNGISNDAVEGGFLLPFSVRLTDRLDLGLNAGIDVLRNEDDGGYHPEYFSSAALSYEWTAQLSTYYEVATRFGTQDPRGDIVILATGVTYEFAKNFQVGFGVNFGVTEAADRINPILTIAARF